MKQFLLMIAKVGCIGPKGEKSAKAKAEASHLGDRLSISKSLLGVDSRLGEGFDLAMQTELKANKGDWSLTQALLRFQLFV